MNKEEALIWLKIEYGTQWPNSTKWTAPEGWRWVSKEVPYQDSEILLINNDGERIYRKMVTGF